MSLGSSEKSTFGGIRVLEALKDTLRDER